VRLLGVAARLAVVKGFRREVVYGRQEIAEMVGVKLGTVHSWSQRGVSFPFPAPDLTVSGLPAWYASTVEEWALLAGRELAR